ncbi:MAG TPA: hypothetical protein VGJ94_19700 [Syntrophorhabdaceae bacterium]|jgi:hypothetical protein
MEMTEKIARELKKKFEAEKSRHEAEVLEHWRGEIEILYRKKYESLAALQVEMKQLTERMNNRIMMLKRQISDS